MVHVLEAVQLDHLYPEDVARCAVRWSLDGFEEAWFSERNITIPERLSRAVPKRRAEFLVGRYCAHDALRELGAEQRHVLGINDDRSPVWPQTYVGSITHTKGFAAAVASSSSAYRALGIDTEEIVDLPTVERLQDSIMTASETEMLLTPPATMSAATFFTFVFSAKESIYKCLRPLVGQFFGFKSAYLLDVVASQEADFGTARFHVDPIGNTTGPEVAPFDVHWRLSEGYVHTSTALRPPLA